MVSKPSYRCVGTTCIYCGVGCGINVQVLDGKVVGVLPARSHPVSRGQLCIKGWQATGFVMHPDRLRTPLIKRDGRFAESSWDEALDLVSGRLATIAEETGPDSLAFLSSAKCSNEENYLLQKLARGVIGTNNVDHCARLCHAPTVVGLVTAFGSGAMTNSIPELAETDCILVTGSNTMETHPIIASYILRGVEAGAKLIVVDPRDIPLARFADYHLRQTPGTDVAWLNGMMNVILTEGLEDAEFIAERTEGFEALADAVSKYTPEYVERITGIPAADLVGAARTYARAERAAIVYAMGITQHTTGTDNVLSCANLAMLTGNVGKPGTGVNPLRGQNNVQGACDLGCLPNTYPGYQAVTSPTVQAKFKKAWGRTSNLAVGRAIGQMLDGAMKGEVRAMYIMGENPMMSDPDINHVRKALQSLDFLVVSDIFKSETAELADVILPAASWIEEDGTFTATDRRVQRFYQVVDPIGDSKPDWWVICEIAKRLQARLNSGGDGPYAGWDYTSPRDIAEEARALTPIYGGIAYERLEEQGFLQWPCPSLDHPGTQYLHKDRFSRGLGAFTPVEFKPPAELCDAEYPLILTTGRLSFHWHTGTMTRRTEKLHQEVPEGYVEVNPADAETLGVPKSGKVRLISRRGEIETRAWITKRVPEGVVFAPFHFAESAANLLTIGAVDPKSGIPEYKVCAVRLEAAEPALVAREE